jgi:hypothetical protein
LDRGICRLGIELRNQTFQGADGVRLQKWPKLDIYVLVYA